MANFSINDSPIFRQPPGQYAPEVMLLHQDISSWSQERFTEEWSKRFSYKTDWRTLTVGEIYQSTGVHFDCGFAVMEPVADMIPGVFVKPKYVSHPDLNRSQHAGKVPSKGIVAATIPESRGRMLLLLSMLRGLGV